MKHEHRQPIDVTVAIITVSSSRTPQTDMSGMAIGEIVKAAGYSIVHYALVKDQIDAIHSEVLNAARHANCIILNGGTGLTHDDCTIEAVRPLLEKVIDGFGELFRMKSFKEIGTSSILSRAIAGTYQKCVIFCIPGSTAAAELATREIIVPEIVHILSHATR